MAVSFFAVGPTAATCTVIVAVDVAPSASATWYDTGEVVPRNAGSGVNVTFPVLGSIEYVPSPGTVSCLPSVETCAPFGWPEVGKTTLEATVPPWSFARTSTVTAVPWVVFAVSGCAFPLYVTAIWPEVWLPRVSSTVYVTGVGFFVEPLSGVKVTLPDCGSTVQVPSPGTVSCLPPFDTVESGVFGVRVTVVGSMEPCEPTSGSTVTGWPGALPVDEVFVTVGLSGFEKTHCTSPPPAGTVNVAEVPVPCLTTEPSTRLMHLYVVS